jgi:sn-glycerol 3-phosphate transport system permease protein
MKQKTRAVDRNARHESLTAAILMAPAAVLLFTFTVYPIGYLIYRSLFGGNLLSRNKEFVGTENYQELFASKDFHQVLGNTFLYTLITVVFTIVLAVVIAAWLSGSKNKKLNEFCQTAMFTPHIISMVSVATLFTWMMDTKNGLFNTVLTWLGLPAGTWLSRPETALWSVALVSIWKSLGYYVLLIMAAIQNISPSVYEAAELDDTPAVRKFWKITLPMISPTILFVTVVATISSFRVFDSVSVMTGGGPLNSTNTLVYFIYQYAFSYGKPGLACAAGVILLIFISLITALQFAVSRKRVYYQ